MAPPSGLTDSDIELQRYKVMKRNITALWFSIFVLAGLLLITALQSEIRDFYNCHAYDIDYAADCLQHDVDRLQQDVDRLQHNVDCLQHGVDRIEGNLRRTRDCMAYSLD